VDIMSTPPSRRRQVERRRTDDAPDLSKSLPRSNTADHLIPIGKRTGSGREIGREPPASKPRSREEISRATGLIRLRVSGLGLKPIDMDATATATLGDLKKEIEQRTRLLSPYQKLVAKRKKMDDDTMVLGPTVMEQNTIVNMRIGLEDRTKIILLHSPLYAQDKEGVETLLTLGKDIDRIDTGRRNRDMNNKLVQELIIQVCCKIDAVETNGSDALRKMRKMTVKRAEDVARESEENKRGVDP